MKLLHLDSSITGEGSVSRQLTARVVESWRRKVPALEVRYRDLARAPLAHLSLVPDAEGAQALEEFLEADVIVIGAPMYNFSIPSQLKSWIDRVAVAGKTFKYGAEGPVGLAGGRKVIIVSSRGGLYSEGTAGQAMDFQESYLRAVFAFLGVTDLEFVRAEGVAMGPEGRSRAVADAELAITRSA